MVPELFLAHGAWSINLVTENEEGHLCQLLDRKESI